MLDLVDHARTRNRRPELPYAVEANHAPNADNATTAASATTAAHATLADNITNPADGGVIALGQALQGVSRVEVQGVTAFSATANTFVTVPYSITVFDDLGEYSKTTNTFTPKQTGDYLVCASLAGPATSGANNNFELDTFINGTRDRAFGQTFNAVGATLDGCIPVRLQAGDTLAVRVDFYGGGSIVSQAVWDWLTISRMR